MPKGQLSDYAALLGQAVCARLVQERLDDPDGRELDPDTRCWLWKGRLLPEGYAQIKRKTPAQILSGDNDKNTGVNFLFHRIAYVSKHGEDVKDGASHLCGVARCFNPDHIVDEPIKENNRRKGCNGILICPHHGTEIVNLCAHSPPCIKSTPKDLVCCFWVASQARSSPSRDSGSVQPSLSPLPHSSSFSRRLSVGATVQNFLAVDTAQLADSDLLESSQGLADFEIWPPLDVLILDSQLDDLPDRDDGPDSQTTDDPDSQMTESAVEDSQ
jgi:Zinc-binding loop region of homing endonuclease